MVAVGGRGSDIVDQTLTVLAAAEVRIPPYRRARGDRSSLRIRLSERVAAVEFHLRDLQADSRAWAAEDHARKYLYARLKRFCAPGATDVFSFDPHFQDKLTLYTGSSVQTDKVFSKYPTE